MQVNEITQDWEFLVLACDGIWDVMTCDEVVKFVRDRLAQSSIVEGQEENLVGPEEICEELLSHCVAPDTTMGTGCDNMTAIIVCLLQGKPYSHFIAKIKESVNSENIAG